jgi:two-component system CheB/CheR fusion protein
MTLRSAKTQYKPTDSIIDLEDLYQHAPCGYFSLSPLGKIIRINQTLLNWLGFAEEELLDKNFSSLLSKGGQMHFEMFFWPMATVNKAVREFSYEIVRKNGVVLPVLLNATAKSDSEDRLLAVNVVLTDITERKIFERELLQSKKSAQNEKRQLQFMADLVPEIIWTATANGYIDYVNARFCQYFDCNGKDTRFAFVLSKVHKDDLKDLLQRWHKSLANGTDFQKQVRLINREGIYEWHRLKAALFMDEEGKLINWFGSCSNINDHVEDMMKKDDFINIASHELKTPLTSLKALLQLLDRFKGDPANTMIPGLVEKANRNVNRVSDLVADLLNASQMNGGRLHLNKTIINLSELVSDSIHHIRFNNEYEIITEGDPGITILADEGRVEQVLTNFITNAIKYAPESKRVLVNLSQTPEQVLVKVVDKGPGIPPEKIPYLFDRYYQVNNSGSHYSGLGLGLYICAEIIKKHGGEIGVESIVGEGSTFWFTLPAFPVLHRSL